MRLQPFLRILKRLVPTILQIVVVVALIITAFVAYNLGASGRSPAGHPDGIAGPPAPSQQPVYTCSMHPQIRQSEPGNCPICGMELVLAEEDSTPVDLHAASDHAAAQPLGYACAMNCLPPLEEPGPCPICGMEMQPVFRDRHSSSGPQSERQLVMTQEAMALARVQTSVVERRAATRTVRLVGQLSIDTSRRTHISANVGGRIDELTARFEGDRVEVGQQLVTLYSPELLAVQREFIQELQSAQRPMAGESGTMAQMGEAILSAMRERLRLAGLTQEQIDAIARDGVARDHVELKAPMGGVVIARYVEEGDYVEREARILTLADLSALWAEMEAFESDLPWLRVGLPVSLSSDAFPGETFVGEIAWIDPMADPATRTTRIRLEVDNGEEKLKPGLYMTAIVDSALDGEVPLVIPESAPLITGKRAVVYVEVPDVDRPTFEGREVVLGHRVSDGYVVLEGLAEGERVVTNGAFKIDSALQIIARPSMMSPEGGVAMTGHEGHGAATSPAPEVPAVSSSVVPALPTESFAGLLRAYQPIHEGLAADDFETAQMAWAQFAGMAANSDDHGLHAKADAGSRAGDIAALRVAFEPVSDHLIVALRAQGNPLDEKLFIVRCPMTFDWKGSDWIQTGDDVRNPYFGDEMYRCGGIEEEFAPR